MTTYTDEQLLAHADRLKGKVVIITGAASGIGREAALAFARYGAKIVIGDVDVAGASKVVEEISGQGGEAKSQKCDVTSWDDQVALFDFATNAFGSVDIVVPNAGISESANIFEVEFANGKPRRPNLKTIEVNLNSVIYSVNLAMLYLKAEEVKRDANTIKAIVLIGSMASYQGLGTSPLYSTAKHGILGLMASIGVMSAARGIRVGSVHPWFADTPILGATGHIFLAGVPLTPVERVAATILCVAADPDPATSHKPWLLPDDGNVLRLDDGRLKSGFYGVIDARVRMLASTTVGVKHYSRVVKDLYAVLPPSLRSLLMLPVAWVVYKFWIA